MRKAEMPVNTVVLRRQETHSQGDQPGIPGGQMELAEQQEQERPYIDNLKFHLMRIVFRQNPGHS